MFDVKTILEREHDLCRDFQAIKDLKFPLNPSTPISLDQGYTLMFLPESATWVVSNRDNRPVGTFNLRKERVFDAQKAYTLYRDGEDVTGFHESTQGWMEKVLFYTLKACMQDYRQEEFKTALGNWFDGKYQEATWIFGPGQYARFDLAGELVLNNESQNKQISLKIETEMFQGQEFLKLRIHYEGDEYPYAYGLESHKAWAVNYILSDIVKKSAGINTLVKGE